MVIFPLRGLLSFPFWVYIIFLSDVLLLMVDVEGLPLDETLFLYNFLNFLSYLST